MYIAAHTLLNKLRDRNRNRNRATAARIQGMPSKKRKTEEISWQCVCVYGVCPLSFIICPGPGNCESFLHLPSAAPPRPCPQMRVNGMGAVSLHCTAATPSAAGSRQHPTSYPYIEQQAILPCSHTHSPRPLVLLYNRNLLSFSCRCLFASVPATVVPSFFFVLTAFL